MLEASRRLKSYVIIFSSRSIDLQLPWTNCPARKQRDVRSNSSAISLRDLLSVSFQIRSKLSVRNLNSTPWGRSLPAHYCAYTRRSPSDANLRAEDPPLGHDVTDETMPMREIETSRIKTSWEISSVKLWEQRHC